MGCGTTGEGLSDRPILNKSYTITADVEIPHGGAEGMLVTLGGRFAGYGLYVLRGKPVFTYNFADLERFRLRGLANSDSGLRRLLDKRPLRTKMTLAPPNLTMPQAWLLANMRGPASLAHGAGPAT